MTSTQITITLNPALLTQYPNRDLRILKPAAVRMVKDWVRGIEGKTETSMVTVPLYEDATIEIIWSADAPMSGAAVLTGSPALLKECDEVRRVVRDARDACDEASRLEDLRIIGDDACLMTADGPKTLRELKEGANPAPDAPLITVAPEPDAWTFDKPHVITVTITARDAFTGKILSETHATEDWNVYQLPDLGGTWHAKQNPCEPETQAFARKQRAMVKDPYVWTCTIGEIRHTLHIKPEKRA